MSETMSDPTREEMLAFIDNLPFINEADEFDREEAIYWFASEWHGGQWSNLYSALSTSQYSPGPICCGPEKESMSEWIMSELEAHYQKVSV